MKILMINKYHHITGGGDTYYFHLSDLLRAKGHQVIEFCLRHPKNLPSEYSDYFVDGLTSENWKGASIGRKIKAYVNGIYNFEVKRKIKLLIEKTKPDIAHIHNIFYQISPSILEPLKKAGIPVVQTLHDYQVICANNNLYCNGQICEACKGGKHYDILRKRCYNNNLMASFLAFSVRLVHETFRLYPHNVDFFMCPSKFLKEKIVSYGFDESRFRVLRHPVDIKKYSANYEFKDYVVFAGRFVKQKGMMTLLRAFESLPIKLMLLGSGESQPEIEDYIRMHNLGNVELRGFLSGREFQEIIRNAKFVIVPSEWYENSPNIIRESFAMGKPVIASDIGGLPELVTEDVGLLFKPENVQDLQEKITILYNDDDLVRILGANARRKAEKFYNPEDHYKKIVRIYRGLINAKN